MHAYRRRPLALLFACFYPFVRQYGCPSVRSLLGCCLVENCSVDVIHTTSPKYRNTPSHPHPYSYLFLCPSILYCGMVGPNDVSFGRVIRCTIPSCFVLLDAFCILVAVVAQWVKYKVPVIIYQI